MNTPTSILLEQIGLLGYRVAVILGCSLLLSPICGCVCLFLAGGGDAAFGIGLQATVIDAETMEPIVSATISGRGLLNGKEIALLTSVGGGEIETEPDGSFRAFLLHGFVSPCAPPSERVPKTVADVIEITVDRNACSRTVEIEVTEETAAVSEQGIALREPILVPNCAE